MTIRGLLSRSKWPAATAGLTLGVVLGATGLLSTAFAVHAPAFPFELDGNPTRTTADDDWNNVFNLPTPYPTPRGTPSVGDGEVFVVDRANLAGGKETSAWSGSNKDIDLISTWEYQSAKVVPDKDNITDAYAKAYSVGGFPGGDYPGHPAGVHEHLVIYFGADRFANNGDAALGFWFFKNDVGLGANGSFTGEHAIGDVLVQIDYVNGGAQSEVQIFEWVGSGGSHGALDEIKFGSSNGLTVCTSDDTACATSNATSTASPWTYTPKSGSANVFPAQSFFEAGIDITALVGQVCFSSFMAETRSSHSETAELKDFALGDFDLCEVDVEKVCNAEAGVSPVFDPIDETYQTKHTVTIENNGFGAIYDVELRDTQVSDQTATPPSTLNICSIASISGEADDGLATGNVGEFFPNSTTFLSIAEKLDPGDVVTVTLLCIADDAATNKNPFANGVEVRSAATDGGQQTVKDADQEVEGTGDPDGLTACTATLDVGLGVAKYCQGDTNSPLFQTGDKSVVLDPTNGFVPKVCVDIIVKNTQDTQRMVLDTLTDSDLGNLLLDGQGNPITVTLEPEGDSGDEFAVSKCYTPTATDGNQTDPGLATYSDTVTASGYGKTSGVRIPEDPSATATCKLCPTCPTCTPTQ